MHPITEAGTYDCRVLPQTGDEPYLQDVGRERTSAIVLHLVTLDGRQKITWTGYLSDKAAPHTKKRLSDLFGKDWIDAIESGIDPFADKPVEVVTEIEYYRGRGSCKVKYLNRPGSSGVAMDPRKMGAVLKKLRTVRDPEPAPKADPPQFDQQPRRVVYAKDMGDSAPPRRPAPSHPPELEDDDIPF